MPYMIAAGHNVAFGSLNLIVPQPSSPGVEYLRRVPSGNDKILDDGGHLWLYWNALRDAAMFQSLLSQGDVSVDLLAPVTVWARDEIWDWARFNGYIERPRLGESAGWVNFMPGGVGALIKELERLVEP